MLQKIKNALNWFRQKNSAEASIHQIRKGLTDYGDKLDSGEKDKIEAAIKALEDVMNGEDKETIEAKTQELMTSSQILGEKMYADAQQAAAASGDAGAQQQSPKDDNVVDADFTEVKDEDKK